jgi:hypothetical protein
MQIKPPTSTTARVVRARRGAIVAVTALACAALMSACGSSSSAPAKANVNIAQVAGSIEQTILTKRHIHAKVVCPAVVPQEVGKTFECTATSRGVKKPFAVSTTPFVVTIQNSAGYVTYAGK